MDGDQKEQPVCPNCARYTERIAELEAELAKAKKHSGNSSKPPSSDIVNAGKDKKKQKKGAAPERALRPVARGFAASRTGGTATDGLDRLSQVGLPHVVLFDSQLLTDGMEPKAAASGVYRSRHDASRYVAHFWDEEPIPLRTVPDAPSEIDMCGTGCLLLFRPLASHRFESHVNEIPAHDWAWCKGLRLAGHRVMLDPRVSCRHYVNADTFA